MEKFIVGKSRRSFDPWTGYDSLDEDTACRRNHRC